MANDENFEWPDVGEDGLVNADDPFGLDRSLDTDPNYQGISNAGTGPGDLVGNQPSWNMEEWNAADPFQMNPAHPGYLSPNSQAWFQAQQDSDRMSMFPELFNNGGNGDHHHQQQASPTQMIDPALLSQPSPGPGRWDDSNNNTDGQGDTNMEDTEAGILQTHASPYQMSPPRPDVPPRMSPPMSEWERQTMIELERELEARTPGGSTPASISSPISAPSPAPTQTQIRTAPPRAAGNSPNSRRRPVRVRAGVSTTPALPVQRILQEGPSGTLSNVDDLPWVRFPGLPKKKRAACSHCAMLGRSCNVMQVGMPCSRCQNGGKVCDMSRHFPKVVVEEQTTTGNKEQWQRLPRYARCAGCHHVARQCDISEAGIPCTRCKNNSIQCDISAYFDGYDLLSQPRYSGNLPKDISGRTLTGSMLPESDLPANLPELPWRRDAVQLGNGVIPQLTQMMYPMPDRDHMGLGAHLDDGPRDDTETTAEALLRQQLARENMGISMHPFREIEQIQAAVDAHTKDDFKMNNSRFARLRARSRRKLEHDRGRAQNKANPTHATYDAAFAARVAAHETQRRQENGLRREAARRWATEYSTQQKIQPPPSPEQYPDSDNEINTDGSWKISTTELPVGRNTQRLSGGIPVNTPTKAQRCITCSHAKKYDCDIGLTGTPCTRCKHRGRAGPPCVALSRGINLLQQGQLYVDRTPNPVFKIPTFSQRPDVHERIRAVATERGLTYGPRPDPENPPSNPDGLGVVAPPVDLSAYADASLETAPEPRSPESDHLPDPFDQDTTRPQNTAADRGRQSPVPARPQQNYDREGPRSSGTAAVRAAAAAVAFTTYTGLRPTISIRPRLAPPRQSTQQSDGLMNDDKCWPCRASNRNCTGKTGGTTFWPWCAECFQQGDGHNCMWGPEQDLLEYVTPDFNAYTDPAVLFRRRFIGLQTYRNAQKQGIAPPVPFDSSAPPPASLGMLGQPSFRDAYMLDNTWKTEWNMNLLHDESTPLPDFRLGPLPGIPRESFYKSVPGQWELRVALLQGKRLPASENGKTCNERGLWTEEEWYMMMAGPVMNQIRPHAVSPAMACERTPHIKALPRFHTCDTCHDDQLTALSYDHVRIFDATKMWFCKDCAVLAKLAYVDQADRFQIKHCTCDKQVMLAWLCHMDRYSALEQVQRRTVLVDEWLRRKSVLSACGHAVTVVNLDAKLGSCQKPRAVADPTSGVWRCKSCRDLVIDPKSELLPPDEARLVEQQEREALAAAGQQPPQPPGRPAGTVITDADYLVNDVQEQHFMQQITTQRQMARDRNPGLLRGG